METLNQENFEIELQNLTPDFRKKKCLLAVSGGADSMVMLQLFLNAEADLEVAHVNYRLRGEDSDLDAALVKDFCKKNDLTLHYKLVAQPKPAGSVQLWARELRYTFMFDIMAHRKLDYIVTAHHLNDQLETFLINLSRGSGIRGLAGMPKNDNRILRPMLNFSKEQIYAFADAEKIPYREDKSNKKDDYLRNRIRNTVVPELMVLNESFLANFSGSINHLTQTKNFVEKLLDEKLCMLTKNAEAALIIDRQALAEEDQYIRQEILRRFGFVNETETNKLFQAENGSVFITKTHRISVTRAGFRIEKK